MDAEGPLRRFASSRNGAQSRSRPRAQRAGPGPDARKGGNQMTGSIPARSVRPWRRVLGACLLAATASGPASAAGEIPARIEGVAHVVDGDTLDVGPVRVRLHGIDTPEIGQSCRTASGRKWKCGERAGERLAELVEGRVVACAVRTRDQYDRLVAVCMTTNAADAIGDLNALMVREGLAWAFLRYSHDYEMLENAARKARIGVWQGPAQAPWEYRAAAWERAVAAAPRKGCPIKGNISRGGKMIYHTPWSPWYARTRVDESRGERWFCDEAEAIAAGWRAARFR